VSEANQFLNTTLENHLRNPARPVHWTRSRAYKKNDQAHVEQKNFTHVRQLLGYGRYDDIRFTEEWETGKIYLQPATKNQAPN
jgi:hypothetical protein